MLNFRGKPVVQVALMDDESRVAKYYPSDIDISKLDVEAGRLEAALKTFEKTGSRHSWDLAKLHNIVRTEKKTWEDKPRWNSGKAHKGFHDVMGNINAHASLLAMLPGEDKYFSVIVGAVKALTKVR